MERDTTAIPQRPSDTPRGPAPILQPEEASPPSAGVTEDSVARLVDAFYDKVRRDPRLGPIFEGRIVENWPRHLATMRAFWSSVMLTSGRYKGNPMLAHLRLKEIRPDDFERWLALFGQACGELFPEEVAEAFRMKADRIAQSLQTGMFYRPAADDPRRPA